MDARQAPDGHVVLVADWEELSCMAQCLNEVCNGFRVPEFEMRIGIDQEAARHLLAQTGSRSAAKVAKLGDDRYQMALSADEARIYMNAMEETIREIMPSEYQTRIGAETEEVQGYIAAIEAALSP